MIFYGHVQLFPIKKPGFDHRSQLGDQHWKLTWQLVCSDTIGYPDPWTLVNSNWSLVNSNWKLFPLRIPTDPWFIILHLHIPDIQIYKQYQYRIAIPLPNFPKRNRHSFRKMASSWHLPHLPTTPRASSSPFPSSHPAPSRKRPWTLTPWMLDVDGRWGATTMPFGHG